ncbi:MAG TPA: arsenate reductase ArsC, partial [Candidatus Limnocylindria bacterium]|nr:arsenate reductase ArsC [Candidatus Limnocylindria bacterium]
AGGRNGAMSSAIRPAAFITSPPRRVVFLCVHNSARSQMAEGLARRVAPAETEIWSAGTEPRGVHPSAIEVMQELGIDITAHASKHLNNVPWREADTVVTLCGESEEVCPVLAGDVRRVHWPLPDPSAVAEEDRLAAFRQARDEIRWRLSSLWPSVG